MKKFWCYDCLKRENKLFITRICIGMFTCLKLTKTAFSDIWSNFEHHFILWHNTLRNGVRNPNEVCKIIRDYFHRNIKLNKILFTFFLKRIVTCRPINCIIQSLAYHTTALVRYKKLEVHVEYTWFFVIITRRLLKFSFTGHAWS